MTTERVRARVFGEVAHEYDRIRPDYPPGLIDDVLAYARLDGAPALEVGAGTGKATVAFAGRDVAVTAVEPDEAMAAVLTRRLAGHPNVVVEVTPFEDYAPRQPFGLLFSAQAWHWTDPAVRWQRAASALAPGGALALFWNGDRPADRTVLAAILSAHHTHAPDIDTAAEVAPESTPEAELGAYWPRTDLDRLPQFGDFSERLYQRERTLSATDYVSYLSTKSAYRMLTEQARTDLFQAITDSVGTHVTLIVETALFLARRQQCP
ncbi:class I SAM-dependent methyltransferase [Actinoplanes oblitus]|uniref:Class I SAM-dependent methyltransferase n=1 Tax=Actinoplanes oblitus TaxID=3040509 RepID=A0ABY8W794_9ACTN|nr:class I SAM-dependent methyltransferase [Actinoplanes oblitus]WIM93016.1 class I SAM-dependent methyltransferase [Actinoplanes oblitus]